MKAVRYFVMQRASVTYGVERDADNDPLLAVLDTEGYASAQTARAEANGLPGPYSIIKRTDEVISNHVGRMLAESA